MSDDKKNVNDSQDCKDDSCCCSGEGISKSMKTVIFLGVLVLAGAVAAYSLMNKDSKNSSAENDAKG